ncbi:MAG: FecR domain-containing protein [Chloroflexi bacterium]|nr:MAG: FecR domain-containing protein [Chloroflexota bacterium]
MATVAARPPKRRGGRRFLLLLLILILIVGGVLVWLNRAASAQVNASATLTVYQPAASTSRNGADFADVSTGAVVHAGDSVKTDTKGRAAITLPDGTLTRLASDTTLKLDSAHFTKTGNLHDVTLSQQIGRTFTNVQHLATGATFNVKGKSATASVRGTKFEVLITADGKMAVKLFEGTLDFIGKNTVHLKAGQQATADANGNIGDPTPIVPDPADPFGPALAASDAVAAGTTPGTEQDFIGAPLHDGEQQQYTYAYAGGSLLKASLGYPGSAMKLTVQAPDNQKYFATGKLPTVEVHNGPAGIYTIVVNGVSGLGTAGEEPFVAVASVESCASADIEQNHAVHRGYTAHDLVDAVQQSGQVSGLSNLKLSLSENSAAGAIITGSGTYNGVGWSGSVVLAAHNGVLDIMPTGGSVFGMSVPAQQVVQQIAAAIGQDPSNVSPGFIVDRLFTCKSVMIVDGRMR